MTTPSSITMICKGCKKPIEGARLYDDFQAGYFHNLDCVRLKQQDEPGE